MTTMSEVVAFLTGEGELDGCSFGEKQPWHKGSFWWRTHLREAYQDHLAKGAQEWQPIETAPKDGTTVLLACGDRVTAGDWVSPEMHPTWDGDDFDAHWQSWDGGFHNDGEHAATHWMPLPAAPMLSQRVEVES